MTELDTVHSNQTLETIYLIKLFIMWYELLVYSASNSSSFRTGIRRLPINFRYRNYCSSQCTLRVGYEISNYKISNYKISKNKIQNYKITKSRTRGFFITDAYSRFMCTRWWIYCKVIRRILGGNVSWFSRHGIDVKFNKKAKTASSVMFQDLVRVAWDNGIKLEP